MDAPFTVNRKTARVHEVPEPHDSFRGHRQTTAIRRGIVGGRDAHVAAVPVGGCLALDGARRKRREARPARRAIDHEFDREAQAVARAHRTGIGDRGRILDLGEFAGPTRAVARGIGELARQGDAISTLGVGRRPGEDEHVAGRATGVGFVAFLDIGRTGFVSIFPIRFVVLVLSGIGRARPLRLFLFLFLFLFLELSRRCVGQVLFICRTFRNYFRTQTVQIRTTAAGGAHGVLEVIFVDLDDGAVAEAEHEVRVPRDNRHGDTITHEVHVALADRRHQAAIAIAGRSRLRIVGDDAALEVGVVQQIIIGRGGDAPAFEDALPARGRHFQTIALAVVGGAEQQPDARRRAFAHDGENLRVVGDALAFAQTGEFIGGDQGDVVEVIVAGEKRGLGDEGASTVAVDEVDGRIVRRLHERAVGVHAHHRQLRLVQVSTGEVAGQVRDRNLVAVAIGCHIGSHERKPLDGSTFYAVLRGRAAVATDMDVIAAGIASLALVGKELPGGHLAAAVDEDLGQMPQDDIGAVAEIDVDVVAEVDVGIGVVHVCRTRHRREHRYIDIVGRVKIRVVAGARARMRVATTRTLRAQVLLAGREGQVDGDTVFATASNARILRVRRNTHDRRRTGNNEQTEKRRNGTCHGKNPLEDAIISDHLPHSLEVL